MTLGNLDLLDQASIGLRARRVRASLSAIGIAIGIATVVAVVALSSSSKSALVAKLDRLGTNLLTVSAGKSVTGESAELPTVSIGIAKRVPSVDNGATTGIVDATVRRTNLISPYDTNGIAVRPTSLGILQVVHGEVGNGVMLNPALAEYPSVVLGSVAASRLGITGLPLPQRILIGPHWFTVVGVLKPIDLAPELDRSALIGESIAGRLFAYRHHPERLYVLANPDQVAAVQSLLAANLMPLRPDAAVVSRPSDVLVARAAANDSLSALVLGLGVVALVVGGIGVANVMVVSVLERRSEIGLRRALGARRRDIALQFVVEAALITTAGALLGLALGSAMGATFAALKGWDLVLPPSLLGGALLTSVSLGVLAGLFPAMRAALLSPSVALRGD